MWGSGLSGAFTAFKIHVSGFGDVALLLCPKISLLLATGWAHPTSPDLGKNKSAKVPVDNTCEDVKNNSPCPQELFDLFGFRTVLTLFNSWIVNFPNLHYSVSQHQTCDAESLVSSENSKYCLQEVIKINLEYTRSRKNIWKS